MRPIVIVALMLGAVVSVPAVAASEVPPPFRTAISELAKHDGRVIGTRAATRGGTSWLFVITETRDHVRQRLYALSTRAEGSAVISTLLTEDHRLTWGGDAWYLEQKLPDFLDFDGDGAQELVIEAHTGGNCDECSAKLVYAFDADAVTLIARGPLRWEDLDRDGKLEIIRSDSRWELMECQSHACAPRGELVLGNEPLSRRAAPCSAA